MRTVNAGTPRTREEILREVTSIVERCCSTGPEVTIRQIMSLIPEPQELPTSDQMQEMINLAYGLGWRDRGQAVWRTEPPTVTMDYRPGEGTTFLYDGKPRP